MGGTFFWGGLFSVFIVCRSDGTGVQFNTNEFIGRRIRVLDQASLLIVGRESVLQFRVSVCCVALFLWGLCLCRVLVQSARIRPAGKARDDGLAPTGLVPGVRPQGRTVSSRPGFYNPPRSVQARARTHRTHKTRGSSTRRRSGALGSRPRGPAARSDGLVPPRVLQPAAIRASTRRHAPHARDQRVQHATTDKPTGLVPGVRPQSRTVSSQGFYNPPRSVQARKHESVWWSCRGGGGGNGGRFCLGGCCGCGGGRFCWFHNMFLFVCSFISYHY